MNPLPEPAIEELATQYNFTQEEQLMLLFLRQEYQSTRSDRYVLVRTWQGMKEAIDNGTLIP